MINENTPLNINAEDAENIRFISFASNRDSVAEEFFYNCFSQSDEVRATTEILGTSSESRTTTEIFSTTSELPYTITQKPSFWPWAEEDETLNFEVHTSSGKF